MRHISNAFMNKVEVTQLDRWDSGPLELVFVPEPAGPDYAKLKVHMFEWNSSQRGGFVRSGEAVDELKALVPHLEERRNPNMILVSTAGGSSELDLMLAGLLPDSVLRRHNLERRESNLNLAFWPRSLKNDYGARARRAFSEYIWTQLSPRARLGERAFSPKSPLRLLAGDTRYWAHRLYRLALDRRDALFEPTMHEDEGWRPIEELRAEFLTYVDVKDHSRFTVHRPLMGGTIWDVFDPEEREEVVRAVIDGDGVMASLDPVIDVLHRHRAHEDFSERYSWIKEDFERSFYSKRARLKVDLVETIDDAPAYDLEPSEPYEQVLFRDVISVLDQKERRLVVALRMGKNASTMARDAGLKGHASISRRITALKAKVGKLLQ